MNDGPAGGNIFEQGLDKTPANHQPLTPLSYLDWAARVFPNKPAVIHGEQVFTWSAFDERCRRLASALEKRGIGVGDAVSVMSPNAPAMLEAHYGVPMSGAVLNALNYRLDAETIAFILGHAETKVLITDREYASVIQDALAILDNPDLLVVDVDDPLAKGGHLIGEMTYEDLLAEGDPDYIWQPPADEWQAICLNYTSGTTGNPKGVVYHHRGAYLNALGNIGVGGFQSGATAHVVGAGLAIIGGNVAVVLGGLGSRSLGAPRMFRAVSVALGAFGLVCLAVLVVDGADGATLPVGLVERGAVYPIIAWEVMAGVALLWPRRSVA